MSLPYDATPPPEDPSYTNNGQTHTGAEDENPALDRPLDEYELPAEEVPEHVRSLMGRMSKGKLYLMEESPGILHLDADERLRRDPRIAALAERLDKQDPTSWLEAISATAPSPIKTNALYLRSDLIQHLSTSKVFSWASSLGASVMGIEWLNDTTLQLIFATPAAALLGLTLLSKAGFDPAEGDDPLLERSAHSVPISLLPLAEPEPVDSLEGKELLLGSSSTLAEGGDGVRRKGRGKFGGSSAGGAFDLEPLARDRAEEDTFKLAAGVDPHARIAIRYATESDSELRKQAKQSEWYKRHGRNAGKEVASHRRSTHREEERLSFGGRGENGGGEGRDFARRLGRERRNPYGSERDREQRRDGRGDRRGRRTEEDLDKELENMAARRAAGDEGVIGVGDEDVDMEADSRSEDRRDRHGRSDGRHRGGRGGRFGNRKEDLDKGE
ncbi:hypothetical protein I317_04360 [Kwoniella heveanensis CBS 569]|nr:hypothetical protein I317_04360 [Kwoniella heveanensis CBS 569]